MQQIPIIESRSILHKNRFRWREKRKTNQLNEYLVWIQMRTCDAGKKNLFSEWKSVETNNIREFADQCYGATREVPGILEAFFSRKMYEKGGKREKKNQDENKLKTNRPSQAKIQERMFLNLTKNYNEKRQKRSTKTCGIIKWPNYETSNDFINETSLWLIKWVFPISCRKSEQSKEN